MPKPKKKRRYEFTNHIMFNLVMSCNEEVCRGVLEASLGFEVGKIEQIKSEEAIVPGIDAHGVRFDVFAKADGKLYDVEMQAWPQSQLAKRIRYYQSAMDVDVLNRGSSFANLPESYVIFICKDNPLGLPEAKTTFRMRADEPQGLLLEDGRVAVVLAAANWARAQDEGLRQMLRYIAEGPHAIDEAGLLVSRIDAEVELLNGDERTVGFMTAEMDRGALLYDLERLQKERDALQGECDVLQGECDVLQGERDVLQGERDVLQGECARSQLQIALAEKLIAAGRGEEFIAAKGDDVLMNSLLEEFGFVSV